MRGTIRVLLYLCLVLIGLARCHKTASEPPNRDEQKRIALSAIEMLRDERDSELLELFYYPQPAAKDQESRGLQRQLEVLRTRFGEIRVVGAYRGIPDSHFVGIAAGTPDFWAQHPHMTRYIFSVEFHRQGPGWILVDVTQFDQETTLKSINFALPRGKDGSGQFMLEVAGELSRQAGAN